MSRPSNLVLRILLVLCLCVTLPTSIYAETPSSIMSRAMIAMMDTLGDLAHEYKGRGNWSFGGRYSPYNSLSGFGGQPLYGYGVPGAYDSRGLYPHPLQSPMPGTQAMPPLISPLYGASPARSPVDGIWIGQSGEIVLVMYGHFRIYASAETYRDGRFRISADRLAMFDPQSGHSMEFDYLLDDGRMILRNDWGDMLLFKQLPIPIPAYSLIGSAPRPHPRAELMPDSEPKESIPPQLENE